MSSTAAVLLFSVHSFFMWWLSRRVSSLQRHHCSNAVLAPPLVYIQPAMSTSLVGYGWAWLMSRRGQDQTHIINQQLQADMMPTPIIFSHCLLYVQWLMLLSFCFLNFSRSLWEKLLSRLSRLNCTWRDRDNYKLQVVTENKTMWLFTN